MRKNLSSASCCVLFCFFCANNNLIRFRWSCCFWVHHTLLWGRWEKYNRCTILKQRRLFGSQPSSDQPGAHWDKTVSSPKSSRLGRGRAPSSNKSLTNIQYNVEWLISKNLKQNCVHQQVPMKLAADLCCYITLQQIGKNFPTSHDPWARQTPINAPLQIKPY